MKSATLPLHEAILARLTTGAGADALAELGVALPDGVTVNPTQGQPLPYVVLGQTTEPEGERTDKSRRTNPTHTVRIYAATWGGVQRIAAAVVEHVTATTPELADAGDTPLNLVHLEVEMNGPPVREGGDPPAWMCPVRFAAAVYQPQS